MLKDCGCIGSLQKGEQIHAQVSIQGLVEKDIVLGNALVDMYAKCGALVKAQEVFDTLPVRDTIAWTALITGYARYGFTAIALSCVDKMRHMEGCYPDALTLMSILEASRNMGSSARAGSNCSKLGESGEGILGFSRYGPMEEAKEFVDELKIESDCHSGAQEVKGVFSSFTRMAAEGIRPDSVTFIVLLIACSHAGLVEEGKLYFDLMTDVYGLAPSLEHYTCMVDLLGRAGHLESAVRLIEKVAPRHRSQLWPILLGSCRKWENSKLGRWVFEHSVKLNGDDASSYVCMSNIYTTCVK
jgi:pentatricopeptide repeat protein